MEPLDFEKKKMEYGAATIVLTGLVLRKEVIDLIQATGILGWLIVGGIPTFSLFILVVRLLWFRRHRDLYNFRNETLHRLEIDLGLYTSRGHVCGFYGKAVLFDSKALKQVHSRAM